jgi:predicted phosphodiesterase
MKVYRIMLVVALSFGAVFCQVSSGPTLHSLTDTSVVVLYETSTASQDTVFYGTDSNALDQTIVEDSASVFHRVTLSALLPDGVYYYRINSESTISGHFQTPSMVGANQTFVIFSDYHLDSWYASTFFPKFAENNPLFAISNGDITNSGSRVSEWVTWNNAWKSYGRNIPLFNTPGNHDQYELEGWGSDPTGKGRANYHRFNDPQAGFYSRTVGSIHFISLNSFGDSATQRAFLRTDLAAADANPNVKWKFVSLHAPVFSWSGYDTNWGLISAYQELFIEHGVDVVLSGHSHTYQHIKPVSKAGFWSSIKYDSLAPVYLVGGRGGSAVEGIALLGPDSFISVESSDRHFIKVTANLDSAVITVTNDVDQVVDHFAISPKRGSTTAVQTIQQETSATLLATPNPFNPATRIRFNLPEKTTGSYTIYTLRGQRVKTFALQAAEGTVTWDGTNQSGARVSAGCFLGVLRAGQHQLKSHVLMLAK